MPGSEKQQPVMLDMATNCIALGKARVAFNKSEALKEGLLINDQGQPSTDTKVMVGYIFPEREENPPGGATALVAVIGGPNIHALGYAYVLTPIAINTVIILLVACLFNAFFPWRRYPDFLTPK